jgi:hypothetical protein
MSPVETLAVLSSCTKLGLVLTSFRLPGFKVAVNSSFKLLPCGLTSDLTLLETSKTTPEFVSTGFTYGLNLVGIRYPVLVDVRLQIFQCPSVWYRRIPTVSACVLTCILKDR